MKTRARAFWVGAFVLAALALAVAALMAFGGGRLFRERARFVVFFDGAVSGLQEGSPVMFRGVEVGSVTEIVAAVCADGQVRIPVYIELDPARIRAPGGCSVRELPRRMDELVEQGLRAQLQLQSLITGQLMVQLDFFPNEPPRLAGGDLSVPELPTKQSNLQRLSESVQEIDLRAIAARILNALEGIDAIVNSHELRSGLANATAALEDLRAIVAEWRAAAGPTSAELQKTTASLRELAEQLNERVGPILSDIQSTSEQSRRLMASIKGSVDRLTPQVEKGLQTATGFMDRAGRQLDLENGPAAALVTNLTRGTDSLDETLQQARDALSAIRETAGPGSRLEAELSSLLADLRETLRSLRELTDYLQRHPEALIRGRRKADEGD